MASNKMILRFYVAEIWMFIVTVILPSPSQLTSNRTHPYSRLRLDNLVLFLFSVKTLKGSLNTIYLECFFPLSTPPVLV
jgi:hypothetical protein